MKRAVLDIAGFHAAAAGGKRPDAAVNVQFRLAAPDAVAEADQRSIPFVFSDDSIDSYNDRIDAKGWQFDRSGAGTVALFGHDGSKVENIIGRAHNVRIEGNQLLGDIVFATKDENPNAETVYQLVKGGYLNSCSVGFQPLEWRQAKDPKRPGGLDFVKQKLLEISVVAVPANENAIAQARAAGIDVDARWFLQRAAEEPDWKVGAATDLAIDEKTAWDGPAAAERILDDAGFNGDSPDGAKARKGFLVYDSANPDLKGSYKLPFADLVDGKLVAIKGGIDAAASRLPQTDIPEDVAKDARSVLDGYEAQQKSTRAPVRKDLYDVGWLAQLLQSLDCIQDMSAWEAAAEGDGSDIPGRLLDALKTLGGILVDMTVEEVSELLADKDDGAELEGTIELVELQSPTQAQKALLVFARMAAGARGVRLVRRMSRAGRVLSAANETKLRSAHESMTGACDTIKSMLDSFDTAEEAPSTASAPASSRDQRLRDLELLSVSGG